MATSGAHKEENHFGYECKFVQPPPNYLQTECSVCLLVLRSPYLISCCGHNFCKECIESVQKAGWGCPLCNSKGFTLMFNRAHEVILKALEVYCTYRKSGCTWKGKLEMLEKHLNVDSEPGIQLQGCEYVKVKCSHNSCGQSLERRHISNHQSKECPQRPFSCEHCNHKTTFLDVTINHWLVCECYPVSCPNNCTPNKMQRQHLQKHLDKECPLQKVECEFKYAGCEKKLCRKDVPEHISNPQEMVSHMSLLARQNQQLTKELEKLRLHIETVAPVQIVMTDFEQHKKDGDLWHSEGFYTHPGGYKLCLYVDANGIGKGKGTHVSCHARLMSGKFDNMLKWPFRGNITIQLLNQRGNHGHCTQLVPFREENPNAQNSRVTSGEYATYAWGHHEFISHGELECNPVSDCQYLMSDRLSFRVKVDII